VRWADGSFEILKSIQAGVLPGAVEDSSPCSRNADESADRFGGSEIKKVIEMVSADPAKPTP